MTNEELIAEANEYLDMECNVSRYPILVDKLTTALEAAEARVKELEAQRDAAMVRIAEAWALHEPFTWSFGFGPVQSCKWCADNGVPQEVASWPCPTVLALESVQTVESEGE